MAEFPSAEWISALDELARTSPELADAADAPVTVEQHVLTERGAVAYHVVLGPGPARVRPGPAPSPDLTLVLTLDAARRIRAGAANAQACLADGTLRLRGNPEVLTREAAVLGRAGDLFAAARR